MDFLFYTNENKAIKSMELVYDGDYYTPIKKIDEPYFVLSVFLGDIKRNVTIFIDGQQSDNFYQQGFLNSNEEQDNIKSNFFSNPLVVMQFQLIANGDYMEVYDSNVNLILKDIKKLLELPQQPLKPLWGRIKEDLDFQLPRIFLRKRDENDGYTAYVYVTDVLSFTHNFIYADPTTYLFQSLGCLISITGVDLGNDFHFTSIYPTMALFKTEYNNPLIEYNNNVINFGELYLSITY